MNEPGEALRPSPFVPVSVELRALGRLAQRARHTLARARSLALWLDMAAIVLVVRITLVVARPLTYSGLGYDEKFYVYGGYSVLHGQVPYRDFQNLKGPLVSLSEALGIYVFGLDQQRFRLFPLTLGVGSIAFLVGALIQRGVYRIIAMAIGLLVASIWLDPAYHDSGLNDAESLLLGYFVLSLACLLVRVKRRAPFLFLGGLFLGATILVKENFVITAAVAWLAFFFMPHDGIDPKAERLAYAKWTIAGGLFLGLSVAGYLALAGGLGPYIRLIGVYPKYANQYCVDLKVFHPGSFWSVRKEEWDKLTDSLVTAARLGLWLPLFAASVLLINRSNALFAVAAMATFIAMLVTISVGHCYHNHYFVLGATGFVVLALPGADALSDALRFAPRNVKMWVGAATFAAIGCAFYRGYKKRVDEHPRPVGRVVATDVREAIEKYSKPLDYILTTGTPDLYFVTGRLGAHETNGFVDELLVMYPGNTDVERVSGMRARLEATLPNVVVIDSSSSAYAYRSRRTLHALVDAYLDDHKYVKMGRVYVRPDLVEPGSVEMSKEAWGEVVHDAR
jgi:hypothetical protein